MNGVTFKPEITPYQFKNKRIPVHERESPEQRYDEELDKIRRNNPNRYAKEMEQCTFSPEINRKRGGSRSVEDLMNWGEQKRFKLFSTQLRNKMGNEFNHSPQLNKKSMKMMKGKRNGPIHDRLMDYGENRDKKMRKQRKDEKKRMFSPIMGHRSKEIVAEMELGCTGELRKKDNGKTENIDFFEIVPAGYNQATLKFKGKSIDCKF